METFVISKKISFLPVPGTNEFVAFHHFFGNAIKINEETKISLSSIKNPLSKRDILKEFAISKETFHHLVTTGFLESSTEDLAKIISGHLEERAKKAKKGELIRSLRFLSSGCNISCKYCSINQLLKSSASRRTKFTLSLVIEMSKKFLRLIQHSKQKTAYVRFFGGEPILDWEAFQKAIIFLESARKDVVLKYSLNTNGMLITDEIAKFLRNHSIITIISLDGNSVQHDQFRKFRNGSGTYALVKNGISTLSRNGATFKLNAVLHDGNVGNVESIVQEAKSLGATELGIDDLCFLEDSAGCSTVSVETRIKSLIAVYEFGKKSGITVFGAWAGFRSFTKEKHPIPYCFGNGEELCVDASGKIFPCYGFPESIGSIDSLEKCFSNPLYLELSTRIPGNIPFCDNCEFQGPCAGECAAEMRMGANLQPNASRCKIRKELFKHILVSTTREA